MGGYGSTRWNSHSKKYTVEDCYSLDTNLLAHEGKLRAGIHYFGGWQWQDTITGDRASSLGYEVDTTNSANSWVRLFYTITRTRQTVNYKISLTTTLPHFGGRRWWFICPLVVKNKYCNRRVGKIHLPPYGRYYGCRHCYDLTYRSCQESDKRVNWLRRNPEALMEIVRNSQSTDASKLFLAMRALNSRFA